MKYKILKEINLLTLKKADCPDEGILYYVKEFYSGRITDTARILKHIQANKPQCWLDWLINNKFISASERTYGIGDRFMVDGEEAMLCQVDAEKYVFIGTEGDDLGNRLTGPVYSECDIYDVPESVIKQITSNWKWKYLRSGK